MKELSTLEIYTHHVVEVVNKRPRRKGGAEKGR
jgi:hypothetical protein